MKKHYLVGKYHDKKDGQDWLMGLCGIELPKDRDWQLTKNRPSVTCLSCKRYLNKIPADPLGPVAELAREK